LGPELPALRFSRCDLSYYHLVVDADADVITCVAIIYPDQASAIVFRLARPEKHVAFLFAGDLDDITRGKAHLFQTDEHLRLFAEDIDEIRSMINAATKKFDGKVREGLAKINIQTSEQKPYELLSTVSPTYCTTTTFRYRTHSFTPTEIILTLSDKDDARAYELLRTRIAK
jgi:hypothetical protein